jgi:hypothetical protein
MRAWRAGLDAEHAGLRVTGLPERLGGDEREHALVGTDVEEVVRTQALADDSDQEGAVLGAENGYDQGVVPILFLNMTP